MVGLDLSLGRMCAVEVREGAILTAMERPLPFDLVRRGDPVDPEALGTQLRAALAAYGFTGRRARLALADEACVIRRLRLPLMPWGHLCKAIGYAAQRAIPFPLDRAYWSWDLLERTPTGYVICVGAAWRDVVERLLEVSRRAGLEPEWVEPRSLAIARAVGRDRVVVLDGSGDQLQVTLVVGAHTPFINRASVPSEEDREDVAARLLQTAFQEQARIDHAPRLAPVVLAGEPERMRLRVPAPVEDVSAILNGHGPAGPPGFALGSFLACIGLVMEDR